ncbi:MAG TPA: O-methyltransferase [Phycisphaerae bacterium]|nr:O-methyltransferase [Phycisphaerae bacterium]HRY70347.1 O-methyltransferase [Phycisphaerae bacterium]HSA28064.1 O-methyltransferase [Phycisphaerae bacterium]
MTVARQTVGMICLAALATAALSWAAATSASPGGREAEKKTLALLEQIWEHERDGMLNAPPEDGRLLRVLTESMGAKNVVEIGTSNGYSAIWFGLALRTTGGKLTTFEIDPRKVELARKNFVRAGLDSIITVVEGDAHKAITELKGPLDLVFIDAEKDGYVDYLNKMLPLVRPGGLILAHNTTDCKKALEEYVRRVTTNPDLETIFLHEQDRGIAVTLKKR